MSLLLRLLLWLLDPVFLALSWVAVWYGIVFCSPRTARSIVENLLRTIEKRERELKDRKDT